MKKVLIILVLLHFIFLFSIPLESTEKSPLSLEVHDKPNDDGSALLVSWQYQPENVYEKLLLERSENDNPFEIVGEYPASNAEITDTSDISPRNTYTYRLSVKDSTNSIIKSVETVAKPKGQWFNTKKITLLISTLLLGFAILFNILSARSGKDLYIRKISGLESMDEAVGRATEMGKPILFIPGTLDLDDMQTIAGLTILGQLAFKAAEHDAQLIVPVCRSMVLSTAKEIVKESFLKAGRPDAYNSESVFYLTDDQFGFVAGVDGIIVREKPAANFFLGAFYAESLILAETGFSSGAIQTAGTAMPSQLPFFVAACDYTLIGEELFAASAYLSKDPHQLGSLKGQDFGKAAFVIVLIIGIILEISGIHFLKEFFITN
jgi:hypothetical protein